MNRYYDKCLLLLLFLMVGQPVQANETASSKLNMTFSDHQDKDHIIILDPREGDFEEAKFVLPYEDNDEWGKQDVTDANYKFLFLPNFYFKALSDYNYKRENIYDANEQKLRSIDNKDEVFSVPNFVQVWKGSDIKTRKTLSIKFSTFENRLNKTLPNNKVELIWNKDNGERMIMHPEEESTLMHLDNKINNYLFNDMKMRVGTNINIDKKLKYMSTVTWTISQAP